MTRICQLGPVCACGAFLVLLVASAPAAVADTLSLFVSPSPAKETDNVTVVASGSAAVPQPR
jgi:hypothetical protein